jgi:hypothetical protein
MISGETRKSFSPMGRYLIYGVGEIILVVIGILIALQINNWNQAMNDRGNEKKILSNLLQDLRYSQSKLTFALERYTVEVERLESTLNYIGLKADELTPDQKFIISNSGYTSTAIADGTLNSILNSEKLELIENDSLKYLLTAYPAEINKFQSQQLNVKSIVLQIHRPILEKYVSLTSYISSDTIKFPSLKKYAVPSDFDSLLKDKKYQNALVDRLIQTKNLARIGQNFLGNTNRIISMIEAELEGDN